MARDILAIPLSTVASESAFSTSDRFLSPHRSRLHPKTLEALMCAQDWLWTKIKGESTSPALFQRGSMGDDTDVEEVQDSMMSSRREGTKTKSTSDIAS